MDIVYIALLFVALCALVQFSGRTEESFKNKWYKRKNLTARWD
jgi:hypothetical protein